MNKTSNNIKGVGFLVLALLIISLQNIVIKWIGGDYPILEIVFFRSLIALPCSILFFRLEGKKGLPSTQKHKLEYARGFFLFLSYITYLMGLAALPLAEIEALRFSTPMMITILSVVILGEKVNLSRWLALIVGFVGVLIVIRPGSTTFNVGSIFILISVLFLLALFAVLGYLAGWFLAEGLGFYEEILPGIPVPTVIMFIVWVFGFFFSLKRASRIWRGL